MMATALSITTRASSGKYAELAGPAASKGTQPCSAAWLECLQTGKGLACGSLHSPVCRCGIQAAQARSSQCTKVQAPRLGSCAGAGGCVAAAFCIQAHSRGVKACPNSRMAGRGAGRSAETSRSRPRRALPAPCNWQVQRRWLPPLPWRPRQQRPAPAAGQARVAQPPQATS